MDILNSIYKSPKRTIWWNVNSRKYEVYNAVDSKNYTTLFELKNKRISNIGLNPEIVDVVSSQGTVARRRRRTADYLEALCMKFNSNEDRLLVGGDGTESGYISLYNYERFLEIDNSFYFKENIKKYPTLNPLYINNNHMGAIQNLEWISSEQIIYADSGLNSYPILDLYKYQLIHSIPIDNKTSSYMHFFEDNTFVCGDNRGRFYQYDSRSNSFIRKWFFSKGSSQISCFYPISSSLLAISYIDIPTLYIYDRTNLQLLPFSSSSSPTCIYTLSITSILSPYIPLLPPYDLYPIDIHTIFSNNYLLITLKCGWCFIIDIYTETILSLYTQVKKEKFSSNEFALNINKWWLPDNNMACTTKGLLYSDSMYILPSQGNSIRILDFSSRYEEKTLYTNNFKPFEETLNRIDSLPSPYYIDININTPFTSICKHNSSNNILYSSGHKEESKINVIL
ncbi:hypothetical protein WA158_005751 [Blastocystis sp. Blastoise]